MITDFVCDKRIGAVVLVIFYLLAGLTLFTPIKIPSIQSISSKQNNKINQTNKTFPIKNLIKSVNVNHTNVINLSILIPSKQNNKSNQTNKTFPVKNLIKSSETVNKVNHTNVINLSILIPIRLRDKHLSFFTNYIRDYIQEYDKNIHLSSIIAIEQL
eukprot:280112_1